MAFREKVNTFARHPIETIQGAVALTLSIFGVYILMPFYVSSTPSDGNEAFSGFLSKLIFCLIFFVLPALPTILGFWIDKFKTAKWRARGCFYMFIGIAFLTSLRILAAGINPPVWFFYLGLGVIAGILYLYWLVQE